MKQRNTLKLVHFASTVWFALCAAYISVVALLQAGKSWWFIVSLSGYSTVIVLLLISLYLFAVFRGVARSQKSEVEHPISASFYYLVLYDVSPFLGALAACSGAIMSTKITHYLMMTAIGSLWATFLVWIIIDPMVGLVEMLLPSSREHRRKRLAQAKAKREREYLANQCLLKQLQTEEKRQWSHWEELLRPYAEKLAASVVRSETAGEDGETEAIDIAVKAWQTGGLSCMRQLHYMTMQTYKENYKKPMPIDYISIWWDGIGSWQSRWFEEECSQNADQEVSCA